MKKSNMSKMCVLSKNNMKLSVIVAIYNIEMYVEKCVRSVMCQTYKNLEIILVDDGSVDRSGVICDQIANEDKRIKVFHKLNGGLSDARNYGIEMATGELIAFVDGDDWVDCDMYECLIEKLNSYNADIAICGYRNIYTDRIHESSSGREILLSGKDALRKLLIEEDSIKIPYAVWNKICRRDFLDNQRFPKGKWYEDVVFTTKLLSKANTCIYFDTAKYNYVTDREGSIMNAGFSYRILTDLLPAHTENAEFFKTFGDNELYKIHQFLYYKRLARWYIQICKSQESDKNKLLQEISSKIQKKDIIEILRLNNIRMSEKYKLFLFMLTPKIYVVLSTSNHQNDEIKNSER